MPITLTICSSGNCLVCFENLKEFDYFRKKYFEKSLKDLVLRFQEFARIYNAVSAQLTVQFVHVGQRPETCSVSRLSSHNTQDEFALASR